MMPKTASPYTQQSEVHTKEAIAAVTGIGARSGLGVIGRDGLENGQE
jgi:hypothetical protein